MAYNKEELEEGIRKYCDNQATPSQVASEIIEYLRFLAYAGFISQDEKLFHDLAIAIAGKKYFCNNADAEKTFRESLDKVKFLISH
jgi:hypothetical protein